MDLLSFAKDNILGELPFAFLIFAFGWPINEVQDIISAKSWEKRLKNKTQAAIDAIYEAEKAIPGRGKGAERLVFAVKTFMKKGGLKVTKRLKKKSLLFFPLLNLASNLVCLKNHF